MKGILSGYDLYSNGENESSSKRVDADNILDGLGMAANGIGHVGNLWENDH